MKESVLLALALFFCLGVLGSETQGQKGRDIEAVFDSYFREIIGRNPEIATEIGMTKEMGYPVANDRLTDVSEKGAREEYEINRKYLARLKSFDRAKLTASESVAADILIWEIEDILRGEKFWWHRYVVDHMNGAHSYLTNLMTELHPMETLQDGQDYCARLEQYGRRFGQLLDTLAVQEKKGIIPAKVIIEKVRKEMSDFVVMEPGKNLLCTVFAEKLDRLKDLAPADKEKLLPRAEKAVGSVVYPAYKKFLDRLNKIAETATDEIGVWKLTDGDEYYKFCLRSHTTTVLTAEEIHELGLKEMERLQKETIKIIRSLGIQEGTSFAEILAQYRKHLQAQDQARLRYPNTPEGREAALQGYQKIIDDAAAKLPQYFSLFPKASVKAQRVPEFQQRTMPSNYLPASLDGKREGIFYVNLGAAPFKPNMKSLTYHEAIPGHHFQFALERESPDYRIFRNLFVLSGHSEGWALYAEQLGQEFGWYEDPDTLLGYLASDMGRAMRLVVDTGIHYKRWTRDQALQYQKENWWSASPFEVDRYAVFPGQACSYMVGKLKILDMRSRAEKELGGKFNLKDFHRVLLEHGSLPLEMLEKFVEAYLRKSRP